MRRIFIAGILLAAGATGPRAQERSGGEFNPYHLDDSIVVSANRLATPVRQIASSITVITADDIRRSQAGNVTEILRSVPGLNVVQAGGPGQQTAIFMRGTNSEHVQMLIDGVKINDPSSPSNAVNLATLALDNIDRIEILRGPQSVLYGSDAMGGVIQIFTRTGLGRPQVGLSVEGGSLNSHAERLWVHAGTERHDYSMELSRRSTDGVSATSGNGDLEDDGFDNTTVTAALAYRPSTKTQLRLVGRMADSDTDLDQSYGALDDPNYTMNSKERFLSACFGHDIQAGRWTQRFGTYLTDYERSTVDRVDGKHPGDTNDTRYDGRRTKFDWQSTVMWGESQRFSLGLETEEDRLDQALFFGSLWGDYESRIEGAAARTSAVYGQGEFNLGQRLFANAGWRYDDHDTFGTKATYRLAGAFLIDALGMKCRAAYSTGFKAPALFQIYDPTTGNRALRPERTRGGEFGLEVRLLDNRLALGATYFHTSFDNLIQFGAVTGRMANVAKARTRGVESFAEVDFGSTRIRCDYTYTNARDRQSNLALVRRPGNKAAVQVDQLLTQSLEFHAEGIYTGKREDTDYAPWPPVRVILHGYTTVNLAGQYRFKPGIGVFGRISNVFDANYEEVLYFSPVPRTISVGIDLVL
ncbi:MAG: TonB-dependent receptor [Candidatus Zixiibacteriota bacterium]